MSLVKKSGDAILQVVATNMHLSQKHGMTINEIINDGFFIDFRIDSALDDDSPLGTVKSMSKTMEGMGKALENLSPDIVVILGDRYEMLATASAAAILNIPIAHIHGGEITEGAYDDSLRHAITKLSTLHFASTDEYARRIVQMGEEPNRVYNVGAPGVENTLRSEILSLRELEKSIGFSLGDKYFVVTFHPVTKQPGSEKKQTSELIATLNKYIHQGWKFLVTMPNSDTHGSMVASMLSEWAFEYPKNVCLVKSLGRKRFFSALKHSHGIIGNSSSGIIEAPSFGIPTVNIGDRQKGRVKGPTVIDVSPDADFIYKAIEKAISPETKEKISILEISSLNPYYKPDTAENIVTHLLYDDLPPVKRFYDLKE